MKKKGIKELYRRWRKENANRKPNRAIVRMHWKDKPDNSHQKIIALTTYADESILPPDDDDILFYANGLKGLLHLTDAKNGEDFIVEEVLEFYNTRPSRNAKTWPVLVVFGEYACKDFKDEHEGETHTDKEWKKLAEEYRNSSGDRIFTEKHTFHSEEEMFAFCSGIERADSYFSSEFYTVVTISEGIIDTGHSF